MVLDSHTFHAPLPTTWQIRRNRAFAKETTHRMSNDALLDMARESVFGIPCPYRSRAKQEQATSELGQGAPSSNGPPTAASSRREPGSSIPARLHPCCPNLQGPARLRPTLHDPIGRSDSRISFPRLSASRVETCLEFEGSVSMRSKRVLIRRGGQSWVYKGRPAPSPLGLIQHARLGHLALSILNLLFWCCNRHNRHESSQHVGTSRQEPAGHHTARVWP